mgnify:CR=1 FL=1
MKEYEVMKEIINACGGSRGADRSIEEIEVNSLQEYIQKKHPTGHHYPAGNRYYLPVCFYRNIKNSYF